ncbi:uncharacterized protein [Clytia hemisphaerica]|uniref:Centrosomin N-terminal motif 1 domain-containing protein n=1 Tax=Clytia hemisphaerica TaxID=252671 RepID=A0A7M5UQX1_9CNID
MGDMDEYLISSPHKDNNERQRFSITEVFQRRLSRHHRDSVDSIDEEHIPKKMDSNRESLDLEEFQFDDPSNQSQTDGQKNITMKDKDEMLQELKKENFDLKLRLYMTQKNSENAEGKVGEYEQQLAALLNSLEEQQRLSDQQTRDLEESRQRERQLLNDQKKMEVTMKEQDEQIHNLSLNLSQVSKSMHNISLSNKPTHQSTPVRTATSAYFHSAHHHGNDGDGGAASGSESGDHDTSATIRHINHMNISHVAPMQREPQVASSVPQGDRSHLLDNDQGSNTSYTEGNKYLTKNYHYHNDNDNRTINLPEGPPDIVGVVRPNNTRTVVDVEIPPEPIQEKPIPKKKKKGIMKVFKLCTGKSGQAKEYAKDDMYVKREPVKVTMNTYSNETCS